MCTFISGFLVKSQWRFYFEKIPFNHHQARPVACGGPGGPGPPAFCLAPQRCGFRPRLAPHGSGGPLLQNCHATGLHQAQACSCLSMGKLERVFGGRDALPRTNQLGLGRRHWNLENSSAVVEFLPPYLPILSLPGRCGVERTWLVGSLSQFGAWSVLGVAS